MGGVGVGNEESAAAVAQVSLLQPLLSEIVCSGETDIPFWADQ